MLRFRKYSLLPLSLLTCGFGEGGDTPIGALSQPAIKEKTGKGKTESGASFSRSDFINWHAESGGGPKFNKRSEHGGYSFYASHERN